MKQQVVTMLSVNGGEAERDLREQLGKLAKDPNYVIVTAYPVDVHEFVLPVSVKKAKAKK